MRTFIAIELTDEIRAVLAQAQSHLKYAGADVKWVEKGNIHLTLKFLGEITETKSEDVKRTLNSIASATKAFSISLKTIGAFPDIEFPRVIWVGLEKGCNESTLLAKQIDSKLSEMGFQKETRAFAAHLTIGRVRSPKNKAALKEKLMSFQLIDLSTQQVSSVALFQSTLTPNGPVYTKLHEAKLAG